MLAQLVCPHVRLQKLSVPFQDFMYGNLFRQANLVPPPSSVALAGVAGGPGYPDWTLCQADKYNDFCFQQAGEDQNATVSAAVPQAMKIATGPGASGLPGWDKGTPNPPNCGKGAGLAQN